MRAQQLCTVSRSTGPAVPAGTRMEVQSPSLHGSHKCASHTSSSHRNVPRATGHSPGTAQAREQSHQLPRPCPRGDTAQLRRSKAMAPLPGPRGRRPPAQSHHGERPTQHGLTGHRCSCGRWGCGSALQHRADEVFQMKARHLLVCIGKAPW